jgi:hypothetical protein
LTICWPETRALLSLPPHSGLAHARDDFFDGDRHVLVLDWVDGVNLARLLTDEGRPGLPVSSVLHGSPGPLTRSLCCIDTVWSMATSSRRT